MPAALLAGVSEAEGRRSMRNNIVLGADDSEESWRELDSQVRVCWEGRS